MEVADWLDRRRPAMPAELRRAVDAALCGGGNASHADPAGHMEGVGGEKLAGGPAGDLPEALAHAALKTLSSVAGAPSDRSTAAELLAADALLTYACEAAAEAGPERLGRLVSSLDNACFAALLPAPSS